MGGADAARPALTGSIEHQNGLHYATISFIQVLVSIIADIPFS